MGLLGLIWQAFSKTYWREEPIVARLRPYLAGATNILDLGAGGCTVAKLIKMREGVEVTPVDVVDHNVTDLPLLVYDGTTLPFADKTFDVSLIVFVLHHATEPAALLREAVRVTRSKIVILEDAPRNVIERRCWRAWDYVLNHFAHEDIHVAHRARDLAEWIHFLDALGIPPTSTQVFRTSFPVLRTYPHALLHVSLDRANGPGEATR
jgi:SAM-dependent methyltransferase